MDRRAIECFDAAIEDIELNDPKLRQVLHSRAVHDERSGLCAAQVPCRRGQLSSNVRRLNCAITALCRISEVVPQRSASLHLAKPEAIMYEPRKVNPWQQVRSSRALQPILPPHSRSCGLSGARDVWLHQIEGLSGLDAFLNAAMLLGGMGPSQRAMTSSGSYSPVAMLFTPGSYSLSRRLSSSRLSFIGFFIVSLGLRALRVQPTAETPDPALKRSSNGMPLAPA